MCQDLDAAQGIHRLPPKLVNPRRIGDVYGNGGIAGIVDRQRHRVDGFHIVLIKRACVSPSGGCTRSFLLALTILLVIRCSPIAALGETRLLSPVLRSDIQSSHAGAAEPDCGGD